MKRNFRARFGAHHRHLSNRRQGGGGAIKDKRWGRSDFFRFFLRGSDVFLLDGGNKRAASRASERLCRALREIETFGGAGGTGATAWRKASKRAWSPIRPFRQSMIFWGRRAASGGVFQPRWTHFSPDRRERRSLPAFFAAPVGFDGRAGPGGASSRPQKGKLRLHSERFFE